MKNNKKTCFDGKETETKPSMCGKIKPVLKKRGSEIPRQKQPPNVLFRHPQIVPAEVSQDNTRKQWE
jgi:hypothetical protein